MNSNRMYYFPKIEIKFIIKEKESKKEETKPQYRKIKHKNSNRNYKTKQEHILVCVTI